MVASIPKLVEVGAPDWAQRMAQRLFQVFAPLVPISPVRLPRLVFASLPAAADWPGCLVFVSDKNKVGLSNGTSWTDPAGGVL